MGRRFILHFRQVSAVMTVSVVLLGIAWSHDPAYGEPAYHFPFYFTNITAILTAVHFVLAAGSSRLELRTLHSGLADLSRSQIILFHPRSRLRKNLLELVLVNLTVTVIVYWGLLQRQFPPVALLNKAYCYTSHGTNLLFLLGDVLLDRRLPRHFRLADLPRVLLFVPAWLCLAMVHHAISGSFLYWFLDFHQPGWYLYYLGLVAFFGLMFLVIDLAIPKAFYKLTKPVRDRSREKRGLRRRNLVRSPEYIATVQEFALPRTGSDTESCLESGCEGEDSSEFKPNKVSSDMDSVGEGYPHASAGESGDEFFTPVHPGRLVRERVVPVADSVAEASE
jgi:hypothetical protein